MSESGSSQFAAARLGSPAARWSDVAEAQGFADPVYGSKCREWDKRSEMCWDHALDQVKPNAPSAGGEGVERVRGCVRDCGGCCHGRGRVLFRTRHSLFGTVSSSRESGRKVYRLIPLRSLFHIHGCSLHASPYRPYEPASRFRCKARWCYVDPSKSRRALVRAAVNSSEKKDTTACTFCCTYKFDCTVLNFWLNKVRCTSAFKWASDTF